MRIHLIRHGQTHWNKERRVQGQSESTLCEEGRQQATALRSVMDQLAIAKVYCSSSIRTRETAEILFGDREVDTEYRDALREIMMGPWEGFLQAEMKEKISRKFRSFLALSSSFQSGWRGDFRAGTATRQGGIAEYYR